MALSLSVIHDCLITNPSRVFVQTTSGDLVEFFAWAVENSSEELHVYSGSFNPLHEGHQAIFSAMRMYVGPRVFELSINRFDKPPVTVDELSTRLAQFVGYAPVLITNKALFEEKAELINYCFDPVFHVGADTLIRIMISYPSNEDIEKLACEFVYYDRIMNDTKVTIPTSLPVNINKGPKIPDHLLRFSSTAIRNAASIKP